MCSTTGRQARENIHVVMPQKRCKIIMTSNGKLYTHMAYRAAQFPKTFSDMQFVFFVENYFIEVLHATFLGIVENDYFNLQAKL